MVKSYCVKQKKQTECVPGSERYVKAKNGRTMMKCPCAECGITKTKFVKSGQAGGSFGAEVLKSSMKGIMNLGRKGASEAVKSDYTKRKIKDIANKYLDQALDGFTSDLSKKLDPFNTGSGIDIHNAILKVAPKKGFVMPGHKYTGPGNPLEQQLRYDPNTGQILEIYQQPTGKTDAVSMQHDVDYSVCGNKSKSDQVKCKNDADRKMVKALDAIPRKERQWGHTIARNAIAAKSKLGMGVKKPKNVFFFIFAVQDL